MKLSREYILGLGSGLVLSALLSVVLPVIGLSFFKPSSGGKIPPVVNGQNISSPASGKAQGSQSAPGRSQESSSGQAKQQSQGGQTGSGSQPSVGTRTGSTTVIQDNSATTGAPGGTSVRGSTNSSANNPTSGEMSKLPASPQITERRLIIPNGATAEKIADVLVNQGFISDKGSFLEIVQKKGAASRFRAGTYVLAGNLTLDEVVSKLLSPPAR
ncbi:MAG: hypothetical protein ACYCVD_13360 [Desulfitobacteriaceae bacterium]